MFCAALKNTIAAIQTGRVSAVGALTVADGAQDGTGRLTDAARFHGEDVEGEVELDRAYRARVRVR